MECLRLRHSIFLQAMLKIYIGALAQQVGGGGGGGGHHLTIVEVTCWTLTSGFFTVLSQIQFKM